MYGAMQAIVNLTAGVKGLPSTWADLESWQKTRRLTEEYFKAAAELETVESEISPVVAGLTAHRTRLQETVASLQEIADHYATEAAYSDHAQEEYTNALGIIDDLSDAINIVNGHLTPLNEQQSECKTRVDQAQTLLLQQLAKMNNQDYKSDSLQTEMFELSEDMYLPDELDAIDKEIAEFETGRTEDALYGMLPKTDPEMIQWEKEYLELQLAFNDKKTRQRELQSINLGFEGEIELAAVEEDIQELCLQLALRGTPIKDGSVVQLETSALWEYGSAASPIHKESYHESELQALEVKQFSEGVEGRPPGLFENVDHERPTADRGEGEAKILSPEDVEQAALNLQKKIFDWMEGIDEMSEPDTVLLESDSNDRVLSLLIDVDPNEAISHILQPLRRSAQNQAIFESRKRAWTFQLARDCIATAQRVENECPHIDILPRSENWAIREDSST